MKNVLTIAGSDSSGGAGIQADLKTFAAHGVYGMSVITSVTAQNTQNIIHIQDLEPITVQKQIEAIFTDIKVDCIKIGMLANKEIIKVVIEELKKHKETKIVVDTVMVSTSGRRLLEEDAIELLVTKLFPMATLITPNIPEAETLTGIKIDTIEKMKKACIELYKYGSPYILLKGGHLIEKYSIDVFYDGHRFYTYSGERIKTYNTHGTGCTLSSAIASNIALGYDVCKSVERAKSYIQGAIKNSFQLGKGKGPLDHFYRRNELS